MCNVNRTAFHHVLTLELGESTREVALLHLSITHNNHLVHHLGVFLEFDSDVVTSRHIDGLALITNA